VGKLQVNDFQIEVGAMDYGFDIEGIIGRMSDSQKPLMMPVSR
jgi:hypothetical protein